jgi:small GTP-binding protein
MRETQHYKVVMLGDSGVGKTAVVNRISEGTFNDLHVATVGSQYVGLPLETRKGKITLELWDTAGQEVYRSLVGFYTREAKGAFLVFDVTSEATFDGLPQWIKFVAKQSPGVKIIVFANKCDLDDEDKRVVSSERIEEFALANKVEAFEGSAKLGQGITDAFERMGEMMISLELEERETGVTIQEEGGETDKQDGCC